MDLKKDVTIKQLLKQKCQQTIVNKTNKTYKNYKKFTKKKNILIAIKYIAKLNVPLMPKSKKKTNRIRNYQIFIALFLLDRSF